MAYLTFKKIFNYFKFIKNKLRKLFHKKSLEIVPRKGKNQKRKKTFGKIKNNSKISMNSFKKRNFCIKKFNYILI